MATYKVRGVYEYEAEIEANSPEEAEKKFLADLNSHYSSTEEFECEEVECDACLEPQSNCECDEEEED